MILWFGQMMGPKFTTSIPPGPVIWDKTFDDTSGSPDVGTGTLTYTCSTTHGYFNSSGLFALGAIDTVAIDYDPITLALRGFINWTSKTQVALHSADMTNVAWVKVNVTANKNQTGFDGVANSATLLTATANGGTCLQIIVLASSVRSQSAYLKRITGTGTIEMTMDGGTNWVDITAQITGQGPNGYALCTIPSQTVTNPTVGFRLGTSGDAIAVSYIGNENGSFITTPIPTTNTAVTRAAMTYSVPTANITGISATEGTMFVETEGINTTSTMQHVSLNTNANNYIGIRSLTNNLNFQVSNGGVAQCSINLGTSTPAGAPQKIAGSWKANSFNGAKNGTSGTPDTSGTIPAFTTLSVGAQTGSTNPLNAPIKRLTLYAVAASSDYLNGMTL